MQSSEYSQVKRKKYSITAARWIIILRLNSIDGLQDKNKGDSWRQTKVFSMFLSSKLFTYYFLEKENP